MCRSIEYSYPRQVCRFSGYSVAGPSSGKDNDALIDDESFDYYQFMWSKSAWQFYFGIALVLYTALFALLCSICLFNNDTNISQVINVILFVRRKSDECYTKQIKFT